MKKHYLTSAAVALSLPFGWAPDAFGQDAADEQDQLRAELTQMRAQMAAMADRIDSLEDQLEAADAKAEQAVAQAGEAQVAVQATTVSQVPELTKKDGVTFTPFGRLQVDAGIVNGPDEINDPGLGFAHEIRRVRIGFKGDIPGGFGYKMEVDFASGDLDLYDAYMEYAAGDATFKLGQHNNFQGLEELTSSRFTSFMERAAFTDAFGFERKVGLSAEYAKADWMVQGGVFSDNLENLQLDENNSWSADARTVYAPKIGEAQLHIGGSVHYREFNDASDVTRYRQRPELHVTDTRFMDTGNFSATSELGYGLEAAAVLGRFHFEGETFWQHVGRPAALADPTFFGGSAEMGLFLTSGDKRSYKGFKFDRVKPAHPLDQGGFGALQVNLRYDYLDLNDADIRGGIQNAYAASLVWTPTDFTRLMLEYSRMEYDDMPILAGTQDDYGVDSIGMRAQVDF
ncbi:hypothetical protein D6851_01445 [Altericroceibacterium spongiae]|uniref:Porin n=1 Tax=Altericroceibacterium spongiae TaxID=2320269 RepID=A0A420ER71_9SPHN|nr:porin [Altericroceibacterium spongiae]RKF23184.1 hypothetical protein D6851_01445 [Altericroceibacterium spongiae]